MLTAGPRSPALLESALFKLFKMQKEVAYLRFRASEIAADQRFSLIKGPKEAKSSLARFKSRKIANTKRGFSKDEDKFWVF